MKKLGFVLMGMLIFNSVDAQSFQFANGMGGTGTDRGWDVAVGSSGSVYVIGGFEGTADFNPGVGVSDLVSAGFQDAFVAKYDAIGDLVWAFKIGGANIDIGQVIEVDGSENVYVGGVFEGTVDFDPSGSTSTLTSAGTGDIFFAKYDQNGNYLWAVSFEGSTATDYVYDMVVDNIGYCYLVGNFYGTVDFDGSGTTANLTSSGNADVFFVKYDPVGNYQWAKNIRGSAGNSGRGIDVDGAGNVYVTGEISGTVDFDPDVANVFLTSAGNSDIFFAKYDNNGVYIWAHTVGANVTGMDNASGYDIAVDPAGNCYITGRFNVAADFDPGSGVATLTPAGSTDSYFAKYDTDGIYQWAKRIGGNLDDQGNGIALDGAGDCYITGSYGGTVDFDPGTGSSNLTSNGGTDIFFAKYDSIGNLVWAHGIGSSGILEEGARIVTDASGGIYITGSFQSTADFDPGPGTANLTSAGSPDIFVAKYKDCGISEVPICLVTVDSTSTKNEIVWEKPITVGIDSFRVYREIGLNNYVRIGAVHYDSLSAFTDNTGGINPAVQSYRYKISVIDTCGNESELSEAHRTIHLSTPFYTPPSTFDLIWTNDYEGFPISQYYILRDDNGTGNWNIIDSVTFGNLSYTDINAPSGNADYIISAEPDDICSATKVKDFNSSKSNTSTSVGTGGLAMSISSTTTPSGQCFGTATVTVTSGTSPYTYLWDDPAASTNATAVSLCEGTYNVAVVDADGTTGTASVTITIPTAIMEYGSIYKVLVSPNPFNQSTTLKFSNANHEALQLVIYDIAGKQMRVYPELKENFILINRDALGAGSYYYRLNGQRGTDTGKLIIY